MVTYKQILDNVNTVFCRSLSVSALTAARDELQKLLAAPGLNEQNRQNGEALLLRLNAKRLLLTFLDGLREEDGDAVCDYAAAETENARQKGYNKSATALENAAALTVTVRAFAARQAEYAALLSSDAALLRAGSTATDGIRQLLQEAESAEYPSPFGETVKFPDVREMLCTRLRSLAEKADADYAAAIERSLEAHMKNITPAFADADYFPLPEYDEGGKAKALILGTPFADEARLYAVHAVDAGAPVYECDAAAGAGNAAYFEHAALVAKRRGGALLFTGADTLAQEAQNALFACAMDAGRQGTYAFIVDTAGDGELYASAMAFAAQAEGYSVLSVSMSYLTVPAFADVCDELKARGMATDETDARAALRQMPFLGFDGLNKIVSANKRDEWRKYGARLSKQKAADAQRYLRALKSPQLFIDSGWGDFAGAVTTDETRGEFDYDDIPELQRENIRRIVESGADVFALCGMIARYCTTGTSDRTVWSAFDRNEMTERATLATRTVFKILRVPLVPQVEIKDELENETAGGLCIDGGKRVEYKYEYCRDVDWMRDAIVHESFHALQAKLCNEGWSPWYYAQMGITFGRVEQWKQTRQAKYDANTKSNIYKVHMYEADARAFETDCRRGAEGVWNGIDLT